MDSRASAFGYVLRRTAGRIPSRFWPRLSRHSYWHSHFLRRKRSGTENLGCDPAEGSGPAATLEYVFANLQSHGAKCRQYQHRIDREAATATYAAWQAAGPLATRGTKVRVAMTARSRISLTVSLAAKGVDAGPVRERSLGSGVLVDAKWIHHYQPPRRRQS